VTAGTLATIAVEPDADREIASVALRTAAEALRTAAENSGLGWLPAARLAIAALELIGDGSVPAVVELATVAADGGTRVQATVRGGTGRCAAVPVGLVDACTERIRPSGEVERVVAVALNPVPVDSAGVALRDALRDGLPARRVLGHALVTVEQQARRLALADADLRELTAELDETSRGLLAVHDELQAANQRVADLVAMLSHDIRQPLSVITGFGTLLLDDWGRIPDADVPDLLRRMVSAASGMTELVEEVLTLTQLDAGLGTRPAPLDARVAATEAVARMCEADPIAVHGEPGHRVLADPRHLNQILTNLLGNAFKYGTPPVEVTVGGDDDVVDIEVRDHGAGVPAGFVPYLFDRFTRADTPASREKKGTGLGLYIVRQLAEANGGTVTYRDHPGGGGCFTVHLPATGEPA